MQPADQSWLCEWLRINQPESELLTDHAVCIPTVQSPSLRDNML